MPSFYTSLLVAAALGLARCVFAHPIAPQTPFLAADLGEATQCFTERAAIATDCHSLLASLPPPADWTDIAAPGATPVFKPFCHASCCVFTDTPNIPTAMLLSAGNALMGCTQRANGLVNGVTKTDAGTICVADTTGANGCFET